MPQDPFAGSNGGQDGDLFQAPAAIPSEYPKLENLRTRLLMIAPKKYEQGIPSAFRNPDGTVQTQNRMTADVFVVDGGPVPGFEVTAFTSMYLSNARIVDQLMGGYKEGFMVLGRLDTFKPGTKAGAGNPWGLSDPTEQDKQLARDYIAAGNRQPGEGPDGFAPAAPAAAAGPVPTPPWGQPAPAPSGGWGVPAAVPTPPWGQPAGGAPVPPWGQPAAAPAATPWG